MSVDGASGTKAVKTSWEAGDEICIFFKDKKEINQCAVIRYSGSSWSVIRKPVDVTDAEYYYAVHVPGEITVQKNSSYLTPSYRGGLVLRKNSSASFTVTDGIINLGTISFNQTLTKSEFQVVIPGISISDLGCTYTLSVTSNGSPKSASENKPQNYKTAYAEVAYPYFTGTGISYGGGLFPIQGIANPDGVAFVAQLNEPKLDPEEDGYKYVFALSDGTTLYYYGIPDASEKVLAIGMAIKLPAFDGKGAGTYWKTSL